MAFDPAPSTWLGAGYDGDAGAHTIILNTNDAASDKLLAQLTDALADPTTGDIREVILAVVEAFFQAWGNVAEADRPDRMLISRLTTSGPSKTIRFSYTFSFQVDPSEFTVTAE